MKPFKYLPKALQTLGVVPWAPLELAGSGVRQLA